MEWSRRLAVLVLLGATALAGCGTNDPTTAGAHDGGDGGSSGADGLRRLGEPIDVGGLRVRVVVEEVGSDEDGAWVRTTMRVKNVGDKALALPFLGLECEAEGTTSHMAVFGRSIRPGRSVVVDAPIVLRSTSDDFYAPIPPCGAMASISVSVASGKPDYTFSESPGWRLEPDTLAELNALLPLTPAGGEPKDPDRPYAWTEGEHAPEAYQVVSVPGMTAAEALRVLHPLRGSSSWEDYERVVVAEHERGVVLFTYWFIPERHVRALSRNGVAASYARSINADTHVLVARNGRVVRSFEPMLAHDFKKTKPLPEESGLDLEYDTGAASWTLLERLTGIHITEEWLLGEDHPGFLLR